MRRKRRQWQIAAGSILHHLPGFPRVKMPEVCPLLCDFVRWDSLYHCIIFLSGSIGVVCRDVFWFGFVGVCAWWRWGTTGVLLLKASGIQCCSGIVPCFGFFSFCAAPKLNLCLYETVVYTFTNCVWVPCSP